MTSSPSDTRCTPAKGSVASGGDRRRQRLELARDDGRRHGLGPRAVAGPGLPLGRVDDDGVAGDAGGVGEGAVAGAHGRIERRGVDHGEQAAAQPLGDDQLEDLGGVLGRPQVVAVAPDDGPQVVRRDDRRRLEPPPRPGRLAGPGDADQHDQARVWQPDAHGPHRTPAARRRLRRPVDPASVVHRAWSTAMRSPAHPFVMLEPMIFTTRCAGCETPGAPICRTCRFALVSRARPEAPDGVVVAAPFSGRVRDVLLGFKYRNRRAVAGHLAGLLVNRLVAGRARRRRRDVGADQPATTTGARLRPGRARRPPRRPPAGRAVPAAARAGRRRRAADRAGSPRPAARADVPCPPARAARLASCSSTTW